MSGDTPVVAVFLLWGGLVVATWGPGRWSVWIGAASVGAAALLWVMEL